jgi:hypothetical protein
MSEDEEFEDLLGPKKDPRHNSNRLEKYFAELDLEVVCHDGDIVKIPDVVSEDIILEVEECDPEECDPEECEDVVSNFDITSGGGLASHSMSEDKIMLDHRLAHDDEYRKNQERTKLMTAVEYLNKRCGVVDEDILQKKIRADSDRIGLYVLKRDPSSLENELLKSVFLSWYRMESFPIIREPSQTREITRGMRAVMDCLDANPDENGLYYDSLSRATAHFEKAKKYARANPSEKCSSDEIQVLIDNLEENMQSCSLLLGGEVVEMAMTSRMRDLYQEIRGSELSGICEKLSSQKRSRVKRSKRKSQRIRPKVSLSIQSLSIAASAVSYFSNDAGAHNLELELSSLSLICTRDTKMQSGLDSQWNYLKLVEVMVDAIQYLNDNNKMNYYKRVNAALKGMGFEDSRKVAKQVPLMVRVARDALDIPITQTGASYSRPSRPVPQKPISTRNFQYRRSAQEKHF